MPDVYQVPLHATHSITLSGDEVVLDGSLYNFFDIYLDRPITRIGNISNKVDGRDYHVHVRQDAVGKRDIQWGDWSANTGLTCNIAEAAGVVTLTITAGTFDWASLSSSHLGGSDLHMTGWSDNCNNICCVPVSAFDESAGTITLRHPFAANVTDRTGETAVSLEIHNNRYYKDEVADSWISTDPRSVTTFSVKTSDQPILQLSKDGTLQKDHVVSAQARHWNERWDDFIGGNDDGLLQWIESNNNGTINVDSSAADDTHPGIIYLRINTGSTVGRTQMRLGSSAFVLTNSKSVIETVQRFRENAFSQTGITYFMGWGDQNSDPGALDDGLYFEIRSNGDNTGQLWCVTNSEGTKTEYDSGIAISEMVWFSTKLRVATNYSQCGFFLNDHEVATISTNMPTGHVHCFFGSDYPTGAALTNNKEMEVDMFYMKYRLNSDRIIDHV